MEKKKSQKRLETILEPTLGEQDDKSDLSGIKVEDESSFFHFMTESEP